MTVAVPAQALDRSARFEWSAAGGPVAGYAVYISVDGGGEQLYDWVAGSQVTVQVASGAYVSVSVAAFDGTGRLGPRSDFSPPLRLCQGDVDGDEVVGSFDFLVVRRCFGFPSTGECAGVDMDSDGWVGASDLVLIPFGGNACADDGPAACVADIDADGGVGATDYVVFRNCYGLQALGACAAVDFDGNGFIGAYDLVVMADAFGTEGCSQ